MIHNINLKNFKCFTNQSFNLLPMTVFCGSNSTGKSTVIQSILSIAQNLKHFEKNVFRLNGELFSFGRARDLLSHTPNGNVIEIAIDDFKVELTAEPLDSKEINVSIDDTSLETIKKIFVDEDFVYLCAERHGPRASFELGNHDSSLDIGIYGQFALSCYHKNKGQKAVNQNFAQRICAHLIQNDQSDHSIFTDALVTQAMRRVCPNFAMKVSELDEIERVYNTYMSGSENIRPVNAGFGVSYVLPIIISAALIKPGGILIVENPEVHLHPRAQSELIKILCELSKSGVQVIVETHSDHIINGIRVFAKENGFSEKDNIIYSITDVDGIRKVKDIQIDEDGNLTATDDGFFDQMNQDLMRLF